MLQLLAHGLEQCLPPLWREGMFGVHGPRYYAPWTSAGKDCTPLPRTRSPLSLENLGVTNIRYREYLKEATTCMIQEAPNVTIQHVVHPLPRQRDPERIQGVMRAASRPEPVGEPPEILLVDLDEDRDHRLLDDLVFQRGDRSWTLPPLGRRDIDSP